MYRRQIYQIAESNTIEILPELECSKFNRATRTALTEPKSSEHWGNMIGIVVCPTNDRKYNAACASSNFVEM